MISFIERYFLPTSLCLF